MSLIFSGRSSPFFNIPHLHRFLLVTDSCFFPRIIHSCKDLWDNTIAHFKANKEAFEKKSTHFNPLCMNIYHIRNTGMHFDYL